MVCPEGCDVPFGVNCFCRQYQSRVGGQKRKLNNLYGSDLNCVMDQRTNSESEKPICPLSPSRRIFPAVGLRDSMAADVPQLRSGQFGFHRQERVGDGVGDDGISFAAGDHGPLRQEVRSSAPRNHRLRRLHPAQRHSADAHRLLPQTRHESEWLDPDPLRTVSIYGRRA